MPGKDLFQSGGGAVMQVRSRAPDFDQRRRIKTVGALVELAGADPMRFEVREERRWMTLNAPNVPA